MYGRPCLEVFYSFIVRSVRDDLKSSIIKTQKSSVYITDMEIILATTPNICSYKF